MSASTNVTYSNLFSQSYINLFNLINTRSNIPDPLGETKRTFVYKKEPDVKSDNFEGYPFIILYPSSNIPSKYSVDDKNAQMEIRFKIEIRSSNRMTGKNSGKGAEYLDAISDDLFTTILSSSNKLTLRQYYMSRPELTTDDSDVINVEGQQIFLRRFTLTFNTRMGVSA